MDFHLALTLFLVVFLYKGVISAPYYEPDKPKEKYSTAQDVHLLSKKTLNNLIAGMIGLLLNLNPEARYQQRGPSAINDGYFDPNYK